MVREKRVPEKRKDLLEGVKKVVQAVQAVQAVQEVQEAQANVGL